MAYKPSNCNVEQYEAQIYSGDSFHKLYIKQGNTIIEDASPFVSSLTWKRRITNNGSTSFSLSDFVSQEIDLVTHSFQFDSLTEEIEIKLGTYVESVQDYVFVPLGFYIIQDNPTTDKNKTTYKLRDKSVLLDFKYNAKPLMEGNGGVATKLEILLDICQQANVDYVGTRTFIGYDDEVGIYDNTITGRKYIGYLFEQAGLKPIINRNGQLDCINIKELQEKEIDSYYLESFTNGDTYKISKVVYESGEFNWEYGTDEHNNLFINASNPYITNQGDVDRLSDLIGFEINSFSTGKVLGNPLIDPWDIIVVNYEGNTYKTFAQHTLSFNGTLVSNYETSIKVNSKQINSSNTGEAVFKKYIKSEIDNINGTLTTTIGTVESMEVDIQDINSSITLFSVDLSQYNVTIPTNTQREPNEAKNYDIYYYGYFKGKQISPNVTISGTNTGITTSKTNEYIRFSVSNGIMIPNDLNTYNISFSYVDSGKTYIVTKKVDLVIVTQGKDGEPGKDGTSVNILGSYNSLEELKEAHPTGDIGDAYIVQGDMYVWSEEEQDWVDVGDIQGPAGKDGKDGSDGKSAYQIWLDNGYVGTEEEYLASLKGTNGVSTYFYVRYSANENGSGMTQTPTSTTKYMGTASTTSPTAPTTTNAYTWVEIKGKDGTNGSPGQAGENGKTSYLHIKYSEDGQTFTPADEDYGLGEKPSAYIGQYIDFNESDSTNFNDYEWYKFTEDIDGRLDQMEDDISNNNTIINNNYQEIIEKFNGYVPTSNYVTLENSVQQLRTDTYTKTEINTKLTDGSVTMVRTTSGTFDEDGMHYEKTGAKTSSTINEVGVAVKNANTEEELLFAGFVDDNKVQENEDLEAYKGQSVVYTQNQIVKKYLVVGSHSRFEDYEDGTGCFYIG